MLEEEKIKAREAVSLLIDDKGIKKQRDVVLHNSYLSVLVLTHAS